MEEIRNWAWMFDRDFKTGVTSRKAPEWAALPWFGFEGILRFASFACPQVFDGDLVPGFVVQPDKNLGVDGERAGGYSVH